MINSDILDITENVDYDESIVKIRNFSYLPNNISKLDYNDDIRVEIKNHDSYLLPSKSSLHFNAIVNLEKNDASKNDNMEASLVSNYIMHMFSDMKYLINGVVVDEVKNPGITTSLKSLLLLNSNELKASENAGIFPEYLSKSVKHGDEINCSVDLSSIFGICADYTKIFTNVKHEIVLLRARSDANCFQVSGTNVKNASLTLTRIVWKMPHVSVGDRNKIKLLKVLESGQKVKIAFRKWVLFEDGLSPSKNFETWPIVTTSEIEKPRWALTIFQKGKKFNLKSNASYFDNVNLKSLRLCLNGENYPYEEIDIKFPNKIAVVYDNYCKFRSLYDGKDVEPVLSLKQFIDKCPIFVLNASKQYDAVKSGAVDVKMFYESYEKFEPDTIIHTALVCDKIIEYSPFNGTVRNIQ